MYFKIFPLLIRKFIKFDEGKTRRMLDCSSRLNTHSESWRPNILSDGTKIEALPLGITIYCMGEVDYTPEKGHEYLLFYSPEYSSEYAYVAANLYLQIYL